MKTIFIVGCGGIGRRVAAIWQERGVKVSALVRNPASAAALSALGISPVSGDLDRQSSLTNLPLEKATVYYFAPPPAEGDTDPRMRALVGASGKRFSGRPHQIVYISTSGVYGDHGGAWVTEDTPPNPGTDRSRRRLDAERVLEGWGRSHGVPVVILRVGGIYGPGRWPLDRLRAGAPVLREEECGYTNRIHADDLARVCVAAAERDASVPVRIYNVSDGTDGTMTQYFFAVADHFGIARPLALSLDELAQKTSPAMMSYLLESRRMDNRRMREELGVTLRYPDLAAGLAAVNPDTGG